MIFVGWGDHGSRLMELNSQDVGEKDARNSGIPVFRRRSRSFIDDEDSQQWCPQILKALTPEYLHSYSLISSSLHLHLLLHEFQSG